MDDMRMMKASMLVLMRNPPPPGKGLACSNEMNDMRTITWFFSDGLRLIGGYDDVMRMML